MRNDSSVIYIPIDSIQLINEYINVIHNRNNINAVFG